VLRRSCYHMTSYRLAVQCCPERCTITRSSVSSHHDYDERLGLLFNKEIQSGYYQNTSVSIEAALLEWVEVNGGRRTCHFGHCSNNSKQGAVATTCNMHNKLYINRNPLDLVERLDVGGTVLKGTDGAPMSYHCSKLIFGQMILLLELSVVIDAPVEAPGHGK
jgi:hypothetical protein